MPSFEKKRNDGFATNFGLDGFELRINAAVRLAQTLSSPVVLDEMGAKTQLMPFETRLRLAPEVKYKGFSLVSEFDVLTGAVTLYGHGLTFGGPLVMTVGLFGSLGGEPMTLLKDSGWIFGKIAAGTPTWVQNAGFAWVFSLVPLGALCWFGMNNLKTVSPNSGSPIVAFAKITYLYTLAFVPTIFMLWLYLPKPTGLGLLNMWVAIPLDILMALAVMRLAAFGEMKEGVKKQFAIFKDKHTWSLTALYIVTFGSFIGFSMALPLSMKVIFGVSHVPDANGVMQHTLNNPNAPTILAYAWIGPFVGAATRPIGGWISDKVGGSIVTQVITAVMALAAVAVGYVMMLAYGSATPEQYFPMFLGLFLVLFFASGIGNGSTFRTIGVIFDRAQAGPVLGWTSAVAAYGAFIAPVLIGQYIKAGAPQLAFYGFAVFYALCLVLNWWFYLRGNAYVKNP